MPAVSIIMPVYNTERFIERSVRSVLEQTLKDMELIVVDDRTPDNSIGIVKSVLTEYPHRQHQVRIISNPTNMGSAVTRQVGLDNATGEYTIHLDSDDYCDPTMIEDLYGKAKEDDADIVICDYYETFEHKEVYHKLPEAASGREYASLILCSKHEGYLWNKLIRRELYTTHGIALMPGVNLWEDLYITVRACYKAGKVSYLNKAYVHYVRYNTSSYTFKTTDKAITDVQATLDALSRFFEENDPQGEFAKDVMYAKLCAKVIWMRETRGEKRRQLLGMYPEADTHIFSHPGIRFPSKWSLYFVSHNMYFAADLIGAALKIWKRLGLM